jgi:hypothetical protein
MDFGVQLAQPRAFVLDDDLRFLRPERGMDAAHLGGRAVDALHNPREFRAPGLRGFLDAGA